MQAIRIHGYGGPEVIRLPYLKEYPHYLERFVDWVKQGKLSIKIARTYPLAEASQAHAAFEQRQVSGRLLLFP